MQFCAQVIADQKLWEHKAKQMLRRVNDGSHEDAGLYDAEHFSILTPRYTEIPPEKQEHLADNTPEK